KSICGMLVKTPSQWAFSSTSNVDYLSSIIQKVDPNLFVKIHRLCTDLLHAEKLGRRYPVNRIASPEHPEGRDNLILDFVFFRFLDRGAGLLGYSRFLLPDKEPSPYLLERALISLLLNCCVDFGIDGRRGCGAKTRTKAVFNNRFGKILVVNCPGRFTQ